MQEVKEVKIVNRDEMRAAIFAGENKKLARKVITLFGQEVEIRQPTVKQMTNLDPSDEKTSFVIKLLVDFTYVPGTDEKVFDKGDIAQLETMPTGAWLNAFNEAFSELTTFDVKESVKN